MLLAIIGASQTVVVGYFAYKQHQQGQHIEDIKVATNGMNKKIELAAHAAGVLEQKEKETK